LRHEHGEFLQLGFQPKTGQFKLSRSWRVIRLRPGDPCLTMIVLTVNPSTSSQEIPLYDPNDQLIS
jgi:hypothetical protein